MAGLERGTLAAQLAQRAAADIAALAAAGFQDAALGDGFRAGMRESLDTGSFRLVWVLDDAPPELVSLVGYLEHVSSGIVTIDLVTVTQYEVGGERVIVPQRVEPASRDVGAPLRQRLATVFDAPQARRVTELPLECLAGRNVQRVRMECRSPAVTRATHHDETVSGTHGIAHLVVFSVLRDSGGAVHDGGLLRLTGDVPVDPVLRDPLLSVSFGPQ